MLNYKIMIRFTDSDNNTLFFVPDGGSVILTFPDGKRAVLPCRYSDENHVKIGLHEYHIWRFAEIMERNGIYYESGERQVLPHLCYSVEPSTGELIAIRKGQEGYCLCEHSSSSPDQNERIAKKNNERRYITPQQEAAMRGGSMFGWDTPAAQVSSYDVHGKPINHRNGSILDRYPMPDRTLNTNDLKRKGFLPGAMLPLSRKRAKDMLEKGFTIYYVNGEHVIPMADLGDIAGQSPNGVFVVASAEWEKSKDFDDLVLERMNHQEEREDAFLSYNGDCFAIYQVKDNEAMVGIRFYSLAHIEAIGQTVRRENYDLVYTARLPKIEDSKEILEVLYDRFNREHPVDYHFPSLSVSDIIVVRRNGKLSCHYCDMCGYQEVKGFLKAGGEKEQAKQEHKKKPSKRNEERGI